MAPVNGQGVRVMTPYYDEPPLYNVHGWFLMAERYVLLTFINQID